MQRGDDRAGKDFGGGEHAVGTGHHAIEQTVGSASSPGASGGGYDGWMIASSRGESPEPRCHAASSASWMSWM
jgi:hypothetical protein